MSGLLDPDHIPSIEAIAAGHPEEIVQKRAGLLLLLNEGKSTQEVANEVGFATTTIRRWRRRYQADGMEIFPDAQDTEAPQSEPKSPSEEEKIKGKTSKKKKVNKKDKAEKKKKDEKKKKAEKKKKDKKKKKKSSGGEKAKKKKKGGKKKKK